MGHTRHRSAAIVVAIVVLFAACLAGCGDDSETSNSSGPGTTAPGTTTASGDPADPLAPKPLAQKRTLKVAARSWDETFAALIVADALGELEKENLAVEFTSLPSSEIQVLIATGQLDVGALGLQAGLMNAVAGGSGMRIVAPNHTPNPDSKAGLWVTDEFAQGSTDTKEIVQRLKGKDIGSNVGKGSVISWVIDEALREGGLTIADVNLKQAGGGPEVLIALENDAVAGAWVLDPFWVELEGSAHAQFVAPQPPGKALGGYIVGEKLINNEPEVVEALVRAMTRTVREYLQGDYHANDEIVAALAKASGQSPDDIRAGLPMVFDPDMSLLSEADMTRLQEIFKTDEVLEYDDPLPYDQLVDTRFVDAVTKQP